MRQAYFATVSWTDANIGKILDAFEATPFMPNTVIAFWGDHGWFVRIELAHMRTPVHQLEYMWCMSLIVHPPTPMPAHTHPLHTCTHMHMHTCTHIMLTSILTINDVIAQPLMTSLHNTINDVIALSFLTAIRTVHPPMAVVVGAVFILFRHLGDNDQWAKMTNYEHATKIPLMIGCGGSTCVGRTSALVEAIDLMPTLLEEASEINLLFPPRICSRTLMGYFDSRRRSTPPGFSLDGSLLP